MRLHLRAAVVLLLVLAVGAGAWVDVALAGRLHHAQGRLGRAAQMVTGEVDRIHVDAARLRALLAQWDAGQTTLAQLAAQLDTVQQQLTDDGGALGSSNAELASLHSCVGGVQQAVAALGTGGRQTAIDAIGGVATSCETLLAGVPGGPVYPFDFPDPDVVTVGNTYFAYATNAAGGNVQIISSADLLHWTTVGDALPSLPKWATPGTTWAPSVMAWDGQYLLYYTVAQGSTHCISVARAAVPQGPFSDTSTGPVVCQPSLGGSIDPAPFTDAAGRPYLAWKSNGAGRSPATIWSAPLAPSGTTLASGASPSALLTPTQGWEGSVVEGPFMWRAGGTYDLFYSGNDWNGSSYAEGVAVCRGPTGPCTKPSGSPILSSEADMAGPGGASVFADAQGSVWIAFHAYAPGAVGYPNPRLLFLRHLDVSGPVPEVVAPV